ncbi:MAG: ribulose-phosphate 3-epimerase [Candidatus Susulua stagnicola]|nr:ribulose-phosphate 3-epimerase [Candidatus Susulua stagnicola]
MIVPALLTSKKEDLIQMVDICAKFTNYVQIDIMDGEFVSSKSITIQDLGGWKSSIGCEAHLMVSDPYPWLQSFKNVGASRIIYHFEIDKDHKKIITKIKEMGLGVGLAVNPATKIDDFRYLVGELDTILFMAVNPGFYGAPFIPGVLEKIKNFKNEYPQKKIGIDGGIKQDNLIQVRQAGLDYVCIGSAILKNNNPAKSFEEFVKLFNG